MSRVFSMRKNTQPTDVKECPCTADRRKLKNELAIVANYSDETIKLSSGCAYRTMIVSTLSSDARKQPSFEMT